MSQNQSAFKKNENIRNTEYWDGREEPCGSLLCGSGLHCLKFQVSISRELLWKIIALKPRAKYGHYIRVIMLKVLEDQQERWDEKKNSKVTKQDCGGERGKI